MAWDNGSLDDDVLGADLGVSQSPGALGRISGKLLKDNLVRNGINLSFRNRSSDPDLLLLDVTNKRIGINNQAPGTALRTSSIRSTNILSDVQIKTDDVILTESTVYTLENPLILTATGLTPTIVTEIVKTDDLKINTNNISSYTSDVDINITPDGSGKVNLNTDTFITGNLLTVGNVSITKDLLLYGDITIGDSSNDTISIAPNLAQHLYPAIDDTYDLGLADFKWDDVYVSNITQVVNIYPQAINNNNTISFDGTLRNITATSSNTSLNLAPGSDHTRIEDLDFSFGNITNLDNTPLIFGSTGRGYTVYSGHGAIQLPVGDTASRPSSPEPGDTRWNTDRHCLECYAAPIYVSVTGVNSLTNSIIANNNLVQGFEITFDSSFDNIQAGIPYYVLADSLLSISFKVSLVPHGEAVTISSTSNVTATGYVAGQYLLSTGPVSDVTIQDVYDLSVEYDLILGY